VNKTWKRQEKTKLVAKWQGHRDGVEFILATYAEGFGANFSSQAS
jgi:hypothetical protein